ncbi:MAG: hypothetical protein NVSMB52_11730 [Chloroflexota bacterium]
MNEQDRHDLGQRLNRIEGQARGIKKMVDESRDEAAILVQLMAMQKATRAAATSLVKARAIACIQDQIRAALATCPGNCDHCDELSAIDQALADLDLDALLQAHLKVGE